MYLAIFITISETRGSSEFGSAIRSWIDVSTVEMFHAGFQAPWKSWKKENNENASSVKHSYVESST